MTNTTTNTIKVLKALMD